MLIHSLLPGWRHVGLRGETDRQGEREETQHHDLLIERESNRQGQGKKDNVIIPDFQFSADYLPHVSQSVGWGLHEQKRQPFPLIEAFLRSEAASLQAGKLNVVVVAKHWSVLTRILFFYRAILSAKVRPKRKYAL